MWSCCWVGGLQDCNLPQKLLLGSLCFERLLFNRAVRTCLSFLLFSFSFFNCFLCAAFLMNTKAVLKGRNDREQVQYFLSVVQTCSSLRSSHLQTNTSVQCSSRSASWIISPRHCESAHESRGQECEASCVLQASVVAAWLVATYAVMLTAVW